MTLEEKYEKAKEEFISISKELHLQKKTYDPAFQLAADSVRSVFNAEPICSGSRRSKNENNASTALIVIMRLETDITSVILSRLMLKKSTQIVTNNQKTHYKLYRDKIYRKKFNKSLRLFKDAEHKIY